MYWSLKKKEDCGSLCFRESCPTGRLVSPVLQASGLTAGRWHGSVRPPRHRGRNTRTCLGGSTFRRFHPNRCATVAKDGVVVWEPNCGGPSELSDKLLHRIFRNTCPVSVTHRLRSGGVIRPRPLPATPLRSVDPRLSPQIHPISVSAARLRFRSWPVPQRLATLPEPGRRPVVGRVSFWARVILGCWGCLCRENSSRATCPIGRVAQSSRDWLLHMTSIRRIP